MIVSGLYEQQDDDQPDHNLRGIFHTDEKGEYELYCLRPTPYPVSFCLPNIETSPLRMVRYREMVQQGNCLTYSTDTTIGQLIST